MGLLIAPHLSRHVLEFPPVNERVTALHLRVGDRCLTVVSTYGPNSSSECPAFLESVGGLLESAPTGDTIVLMRDFCASHSLSIANTMFKDRGVHQCTWHQDTLGQRSIIDFVANNRLRGHVI